MRSGSPLLQQRPAESAAASGCGPDSQPAARRSTLPWPRNYETPEWYHLAPSAGPTESGAASGSQPAGPTESAAPSACSPDSQPAVLPSPGVNTVVVTLGMSSCLGCDGLAISSASDFHSEKSLKEDRQRRSSMPSPISLKRRSRPRRLLAEKHGRS